MLFPVSVPTRLGLALAVAAAHGVGHVLLPLIGHRYPKPNYGNTGTRRQNRAAAKKRNQARHRRACK